MENQITNPVKNIICNSWKGRITGQETTLQLLQLFVSNPQVQEYCFTKNYPSIEKLDAIKDEALFFNVFINQFQTLINPHKAFVFGDSVLKIVATGFNVVHVSATHESLIHIQATGHSIVVVELYEQATCIVHKGDGAKIRIINK